MTDIKSTRQNIQYSAPNQTIDTLQYSILASGSTGNSTYIETNQKKILVDAGLSGKKITELMAQIDRHPEDLDAIFVTHEHSDHIHGVGVLSRRYHLPIYANRKTWSQLDGLIGQIDPELRFYIEPGEMLDFGDLDILSFNVSHDAIDPQFYAFQKNNKQFVLLTDTGYVSQRLRDQLGNANAYLIESNHEIELLRYGNYPWHLKQRILSDKGHLSNEDGALAMVDMIGNKTERIFLGHLSQENNTKLLAMDAMTDTLNRHDIGLDESLGLYHTSPDQASRLFKL